MPFRVSGLPRAPFAPLFDLSDEELAAHLARRVVADATPGYPCRISLEDAAPGEELLLVHYEHQAAATPYRASHAVYVRKSAIETAETVDRLPSALAERLLSLRAFDVEGAMIAGEVAEGDAAVAAIEAMLADPAAAYIHAHYAKRGCYAALIDRR